MYQVNGNKYKNQILQIRHEEFSFRPVETARKIFDFIGKLPTKNVLNWVQESTTQKCSNGKGSQGTCRNAIKVVSAWRSWYKWEEVKKIQDICEGALKLNNYKIYDSLFDLLDLDEPSF